MRSHLSLASLKKLKKCFGTFYDSQSGQHISVSNIVRVHDTSRVSQLRDLITLLYLSPASIEISGTIDELSEKTSRLDIRPVQLAFESDDTANFKLPPSAIITLETTKKSNISQIADQLGFLREKAAQNGQVTSIRVNYNPKTALVNEFEVFDIANEISTLADAGADQIFLQTVGMDIDEDVLRAVIEESFNVDINGNPMMERLGLRGDVYTTQFALECGVKHIATCSRRQLNIIAGKAVDTGGVGRSDTALSLNEAYEILTKGNFSFVPFDTDIKSAYEKAMRLCDP